ncbi:MAG: hypothetical protein FWE37_06635 [Spirochaetaceae bacterium]|nr:hypothetical protein [Spirochaetaceae bacterium]
MKETEGLEGDYHYYSKPPSRPLKEKLTKGRLNLRKRGFHSRLITLVSLTLIAAVALFGLPPLLNHSQSLNYGPYTIQFEARLFSEQTLVSALFINNGPAAATIYLHFYDRNNLLYSGQVVIEAGSQNLTSEILPVNLNEVTLIATFADGHRAQLSGRVAGNFSLRSLLSF